MDWTLATRAESMNPSVIREILKVTERPGIISLAGGLPSPRTFPMAAFADACETVLGRQGEAALQYAASEGYGPLREAVAERLPWPVDPAQVLIPTGSQQGLDLVAKLLIDRGSTVLVETPTYLGALQAFATMEPRVAGVASDREGVLPDDLERQARHECHTALDGRRQERHGVDALGHPEPQEHPAGRGLEFDIEAREFARDRCQHRVALMPVEGPDGRHVAIQESVLEHLGDDALVEARAVQVGRLLGL